MTPTGPEQTEHRFPCEQCGSDLRFDPEAGQLTCDHCGNSETLDTRSFDPIRERPIEAGLAMSEPSEMEETRVSTCPNCAAQVEFDPDTHAAECPFCATPVVTDTGTHRHIKPGAVLPFALSEREARKAMTDWLGSLWFAPSGLQDFARKGRRLQGIYVPYWTYDAATRTKYIGERGVIYYVTKTVVRDGKRHQQRIAKTRWHQAKGTVSRQFDDVLVLGSQSLPKDYTDALAPWDLTDLTPYSPEYLAGFRAEGYTVELEDGLSEARDHMDARILRDIRFDIGGDRQRVHDADTQYSKVTYKHVLLPIWLAAYKYRGKSYRFVVNGQTGRVKGARPYSAFKIAIAVILGLCIAATLGYMFALTEAGAYVQSAPRSY